LFPLPVPCQWNCLGDDSSIRTSRDTDSDNVCSTGIFAARPMAPTVPPAASLAPNDSPSPTPSTADTNQVLQMTKALRGYARYVIAQDPTTGQQFTIGMRYVLNTEGGRELSAGLKKNTYRAHKRHLTQWLCRSVLEGFSCPFGEQCPHLHVTAEGYAARRPWIEVSQRIHRRGDPKALSSRGMRTFVPRASWDTEGGHPIMSPASQDGGESSVPLPELQPSGPYSPSVDAPRHPGILASPPFPPAPRSAPPFHGDHESQQRFHQLKRRLGSHVDYILTLQQYQQQQQQQQQRPSDTTMPTPHPSAAWPCPSPIGWGPLPIVPEVDPDTGSYYSGDPLPHNNPAVNFTAWRPQVASDFL